jgi:hypothetical protein
VVTAWRRKSPFSLEAAISNWVGRHHPTPVNHNR